MYEIQKLSKIDAIQASIDDDRLNNNNNNGNNDNDDEEDEGTLTTEVNAGNNATSSTSDANGNFISSSPDENALDMINGKGVIKLDMSRIIDPTGLPTYEAALKLKSSSYI